MKGFHFNFKDLFRSARIAFSLQRVWINAIGLLVGYLIYLVVTYISLLIGGYGFEGVWQKFGLLPCAFALAVPWFSTVIYVIGLAIFISVILLTNTAVARVVYMVLRNEIFYTWTQAFKFAFRKWISVNGAMLTFILMIVFFVVGALVMGLIGRINYVGEFITAIFTLPYMFSAILLFFIAIVFGIGLLFIPAIVATSDEDALGGVFQAFSMTFNQPWRIVVYGAVVSILEVAGIILLAIAVKISYNIFIDLFSVTMGDKIYDIQSYLFYIIDNSLPALYGWIHSLPANLGNAIYFMNRHLMAPEVPGTYSVSAYIFAIFMLLIGGAVLAYGEAIGNAGLTIIYVILYKKHEDENLLEREDEELKEEEEEETPQTEAEKPEEESGAGEKKPGRKGEEENKE